MLGAVVSARNGTEERRQGGLRFPSRTLIRFTWPFRPEWRPLLELLSEPIDINVRFKAHVGAVVRAGAPRRSATGLDFVEIGCRRGVRFLFTAIVGGFVSQIVEIGDGFVSQNMIVVATDFLLRT